MHGLPMMWSFVEYNVSVQEKFLIMEFALLNIWLFVMVIMTIILIGPRIKKNNKKID
jgi:hypothetical protein